MIIRNSTQKKTNEMVMQLKMLTNAVAKLTKTLANKENNGSSNVGCSGGGGGKNLGKCCDAWVATVGPTATILPATGTQA